MCLRADSAFPPRNQGLPYCEVSIHQPDKPETELDEPETEPLVTIGLSGEFINQLHTYLGWNAWPIGYHADDGFIYEEHMQRSKPPGVGLAYGPGNTVGCGIDFNNSQYLFALDGEVVCMSHEANPGDCRRLIVSMET
jgi:hypothetical protein